MTPAELAVHNTESLIDNLVTSALLTKLQIDNPKKIAEDMNSTLKIANVKSLEPGDLVEAYSKGLICLLDREYPGMRVKLVTEVTNLLAKRLFRK